jgi:signal transduction histidine kinase
MNGVIGMTELLLLSDLDAEQRSYVETIHKSGQALVAVINEVLDFSKIEAGKLEIETIEFGLENLIEQTIALFMPTAQNKGIGLTAQLEGIPKVVLGDGPRVQQVLSNLISNGVKFTEQGEVNIVATCAQVSDDRTAIRIEVRDSGIGIAPASLERIFESFSQADGSTTRRFGGTGLGLTISKRRGPHGRTALGRKPAGPRKYLSFGTGAANGGIDGFGIE